MGIILRSVSFGLLFMVVLTAGGAVGIVGYKHWAQQEVKVQPPVAEVETSNVVVKPNSEYDAKFNEAEDNRIKLLSQVPSESELGIYQCRAKYNNISTVVRIEQRLDSYSIILKDRVIDSGKLKVNNGVRNFAYSKNGTEMFTRTFGDRFFEDSWIFYYFDEKTRDDIMVHSCEKIQ